MPLTLSQVLPPTRSGRTFFVASSLLGVCALFQLGLLGWYFAHGGARKAAAAAQAAAGPGIPRFAETMQPTVATLELPTVSVPIQSNLAGNATADGQSSYSLLPQPTPVPGQPLPGGSSGDALEQARALRQRGDMRAALSRLREALVAEPDNAQAIAELALTYEAMPDLGDKAAEQWQRIYSMGESVGAPYYLADVKLHGGANSGSSDANARRAGSSTSVDNTLLKITDITAEDIPDPTTEKKVALKIVVKSRPGVVIDPTKVRIDAYFYDLVDGTAIMQTDAQTDYAWLTPPPINWANDKSEVLEALYVRPKGMALMAGAPSSTAPATTRTGSRRAPRSGGKVKTTPDGAEPQPSPGDPPAETVRRYLGYSVRLYYQGQLQEVQADPVRLLQQFQAPLTLPADGQPSDNSSVPH